MKKNAALVALCALVVLVLTGGTWNTRDISSTVHQFARSAPTSGLLLPSSTLRSGLPYISIVEYSSAGSPEDTLYIYARDVTDGRNAVILTRGSTYEGYFPRGIDSIVVAATATACSLMVEVTN